MYYFKELIHVLYLMKQLHDLGKSEIIESVYDSQITDDDDLFIFIYQDAAYSAIQGIFKSCRMNSEVEDYYDCYDIAYLADKVITDYYRLAGRYGKREKIKRKDNPYLEDARKEAQRNFCFSYSLDWRIHGYTNPKYAHRSRLDIFIDYNGDVEIIGVAISLADMYKFFSEKGAELREKLSQCQRMIHGRSRLAVSRDAMHKRKKIKRQKRAVFRSPRCAKRIGRLEARSVIHFVNAELREQREAIAA